jgi:hypothetical protein
MSGNYRGLTFKTPLEAQWAAFFDLAGWSWNSNPSRVGNWAPDFLLKFDCDHSECGGYHTLLATVLPVSSIEAFGNHPCMEHSYGIPTSGTLNDRIGVDGGAAFGLGPSVTQWEISHGSGGGVEHLEFRVPNAMELWNRAATLIK